MRVARTHIEPCRTSSHRRDQRRQRLHVGAALQQPAAREQIAAGLTGQAKRLKEVTQYVGRDSLWPTGEILPLDGNAGAMSEIAYHIVRHWRERDTSRNA